MEAIDCLSFIRGMDKNAVVHMHNGAAPDGVFFISKPQWAPQSSAKSLRADKELLFPQI